MQPFIALIILFGGNFPPVGWAFCNGQLLPIDQYSTLFALLGTTYGGDGIQTFALPDLRGRMAIHPGQGPGLPNYGLGEQSGSPTTTLTVANLPAHTHALNAVSDAGNVSAPAGAFLANTGGLDPEYKTTGTTVAMNASAIGQAGSSQSFDNMPPYLGLNYIISLFGIFPSSN